MSWFHFEFLDKRRKEEWLPRLFDLLYHNMKEIAPGEGSYSCERSRWLAAVGPGLDKEPRQIILMYAGEELAGYFQYYVNNGTFMVEEIQIVPAYRRTTLLLALFRHLDKVLPENIETIAACADERNLHSRSVIQRLGMTPIEEVDDNGFCFYDGDFSTVAARFRR